LEASTDNVGVLTADLPAEPQPEPAKIIKQIVPISRILADHSLQVRGETRAYLIEEYKTIIAEQGYMDPLDLFYENPLVTPIGDNTMFLLADGFNRLEAYRSLGHKKVRCNLRMGDRTDALIFSLRRNGHHGEPMTNDQKRHAAELAVSDPKVGNKTDKEIASMIGCSAALISEARRGITREAKSEKRKSKAAAVAPAEVNPADPAADKPPSGKQETESPAPRSATARERRPPADNRPTKDTILRELQGHIDLDLVDEIDIVALFQSANGEYRFVPKAGEEVKVKIIGTTGRKQFEGKMVVKDICFDGLTLKYEGTGKLAVTE
jgi:ParB-like chromosome segregation protein Spo0J